MFVSMERNCLAHILMFDFYGIGISTSLCGRLGPQIVVCKCTNRRWNKPRVAKPLNELMIICENTTHRTSGADIQVSIINTHFHQYFIGLYWKCRLYCD